MDMFIRLAPDLNRGFTSHSQAFFIVFLIIVSNFEALVNTKRLADINFSSFPPQLSTHSLISLFLFLCVSVGDHMGGSH